MGKIKDKIYNKCVRENGRVWYEYERYVKEHITEHDTHRLQHLLVLFKLNWFYRVKKGNTPYLYRDVPMHSEKFEIVGDGKAENTDSEFENNEKMYDGTPIQLKVIDFTDSVVRLEWNAGAGIGEYMVLKQEDGNMPFRIDGRTGKNTFNVRKLSGDKKYRFKITVVFSKHKKIESNVVEVNTLPVINGKEANPYLDGPESEILARRTVHFLGKELLDYEIISFDLFDTLVFRPFSEPRNMFMMLDYEFNCLGFADIRQKAEMTAREKAQLERGNREVSIWEIYEEIEKVTGIDKNFGVTKEMELEIKLCYANEYMLRLFNLLKYCGKRIIITSDMYLTSEILRAVLEHCGYEGYEEIYVSCEWNSNKYTGTLYENISNVIGCNRAEICHIGDNKKADYEQAGKAGWTAVYYQSCNDAGNRYRANQYGMTPLTGAAYAGICNNKLYAGLHKYSVYYEYGFLYGGLYVYGFCQWLHKQALEKQASKIIFLARDGYIYKKVYDTLFQDIPSEYVLWSRIANSCATIEKDKFLFIQRNIRVKAGYELKTTIESLLKLYELEELEETLAEFHLRKTDYITPVNVKMVEKWVIQYWDQIIECCRKKEKNCEMYIKKIIGNAGNIVLVDTGWQGTTLLGLKWLIQEKWKCSCAVHCFLAASETANPIVNQTQILSGEIQTYMFSLNYNRDLYLYHKKSYKHSLASLLFEIFTQAPHATFNGFTNEKDGFGFQFGIPEVENYEMVEQIQTGIMDFARLYEERFGQFPFMKNISGRDAYIPFQFISKNPRLFRKYFMEFSYSKSSGGDIGNQKTETMRELFEAAK